MGLKGLNCFLFLIFWLLGLAVSIFQLVGLLNGLGYIISIRNCETSSKFFRILPLFPDIQGSNSTLAGNITFDSGNFYFQDWHLLPSLGLCPSKNSLGDAQLSEAASSLASSSSSARRKLKSSAIVRVLRTKASYRRKGPRRGITDNNAQCNPMDEAGLEAKLTSCFSYIGCVSFGQDVDGNTDSSGPTIWSQLDSLSAIAGYNGVSSKIKTNYKQGSKDFLSVDTLMVALTGVNVAFLGVSLFSYCYALCTRKRYLIRKILWIDFINYFITFILSLAVISLSITNGDIFVGTTGKSGLVKTIFPTCTLSVTMGPIFYCYGVCAALCFFLMFVFIAERACHVSMRRKVACYNFPPGTIICDEGHPMTLHQLDPYTYQHSHAVCNWCEFANFYERDECGYHCALCRTVKLACDYCPGCAQTRLDSGKNGTLGVSKCSFDPNSNTAWVENSNPQLTAVSQSVIPQQSTVLSQEVEVPSSVVDPRHHHHPR